MARNAVSTKKIPAELRRSWGWLLGFGIMFILLGCIGLSMVVGVTLASILFLGILLLMGGIIQFIDVFKSRRWKGALLHACIAFFYFIGGAAVIYDPLLTSAIITAFIAWILIIIGIARLIMAFMLRHSREWVWLSLAGIIALILGIMILAQWPLSGLWIIGLFISIELLVNGLSYVLIALTLRTVK